MKKILALLLVTLFTLTNIYSQGAKELPSQEKVYKIGISKIVSHPALDAIEQGIEDALKAKNMNVELDKQNCNGDIATAISIAQLFKDSDKDLVIGIATPPAQALATVFQNSEVPVEFAAITDPKSAGLEVEKGEKTNVCGISDSNPVELQLQTFIKAANIETLGMVYSSGESNGVAVMERVKAYCEANNIGFVTAAVSSSAEVKLATQSIIDRVDGIFVANDNTVVSAIASVDQVCYSNEIPLFNSDISSSEGTNFFMSWGLDYYKVGTMCGDLAARLLEGEDPSEIGSIYLTDISQFQLMINLDTVARLNIDLDNDILQKASILVKDGEIVK